MRRLAFSILPVAAWAACGGGAAQDPDAGASSPTVWTDVTFAAGLPTEAYACLVFDDLDGDGLPDLVVGTAPPGLEEQGVLTAFRNQGAGTFERIPIPVAPFAATSCEAGDFTGDGVLDLVVGHAPAGISLLRGLGGFSFEDVSALLPALSPDPEATAVTTTILFDLEGDGWLDLYAGLGSEITVSGCAMTATDFTCTGVHQTWAPTRLYRNDQGGGFTGIPAPGDSSCLVVNAGAALDWDRDGRIDLIASLDFTKNAVYRNVDGTGVFQNLAPALGIDRYNHGMGTAHGDFDGDGELDLYVADLGPDQFYFARGGAMVDRTAELGIADWTRFHSGWAPLGGDFDLDGRLDLFVVNTAIVFNEADLEAVAKYQTVVSGRQADYVYRNLGDAFALDLVDHIEGTQPQVGVGVAAMADYDADGDLDVAEYYAPYFWRLLRNDTPHAGHWLSVDVGGSPAAAVGARVTLRAGDLSLVRVVGPTGSPGKSQRAQHFGLGQRATVDEVLVLWLDGTESRVGPLAADQTVTVDP